VADIIKAEREKIGFINGLRGIAIVMVVAFHAYRPSIPTFRFGEISMVEYFLIQPLLTGGWLGVNIFFVLSGFVLFMPFCKREQGDFDARRFLRKRARRLLPLYYLNALICLLLLVGQPAFLLHTFLYAFALFPTPIMFAPSWNPPLWSLGIEIWYSILFPVLIAIGHAAGIRKTLLCLICGSAIVHWAGLQLMWDGELRLNGLSDTLPGRLSDFCIGMLTAHLWVRWPVNPRIADVLSAVGAVLMAGAFIASSAWYLGDLPRGAQTVSGLALASGVACLILALKSQDTLRQLRQVLEFRPLQIIGMMCFSIYLWHLLLMHAFTLWLGNTDWVRTETMSIYVMLLLLISAMSYRFIEFSHIDTRTLFLLPPRIHSKQIKVD